MRMWALALCITLLGATVAFASEISGWSEGQPAVGTANVLKPNDPFAIDLPDFVSSQIEAPTALFYFSPTCPHCQNVMPEVNELAQSGIYNWIGIASSSSDAIDRTAFEEHYKPKFPNSSRFRRAICLCRNGACHAKYSHHSAALNADRRGAQV